MLAISSFHSKSSQYRRFQGPQHSARRNDRIRAKEVRVIDPEGQQRGVMSLEEALALAKTHGMDLVEISATAHPPVCKIIDFGKYQYEASKKQKGQRDPSTKIKEVKFRLNIEPHDCETKIKHGISFLEEGDKVKVVLSLRMREMERQEFGMNIIRRVMSDLASYGTSTGEPRLAGRDIVVMFTPKIQNSRKK